MTSHCHIRIKSIQLFHIAWIDWKKNERSFNVCDSYLLVNTFKFNDFNDLSLPLPPSLRLFKGTNGEPLIQWTLSCLSLSENIKPLHLWIWTRIMRNTFTNDLILFFILSLPISLPPHMDASLLDKHYKWGQWRSVEQLTWEEASRSCRSVDNVYKPLGLSRHEKSRWPWNGTTPLCWIN